MLINQLLITDRCIRDMINSLTIPDGVSNMLFGIAKGTECNSLTSLIEEMITRYSITYEPYQEVNNNLYNQSLITQIVALSPYRPFKLFVVDTMNIMYHYPDITGSGYGNNTRLNPTAFEDIHDALEELYGFEIANDSFVDVIEAIDKLLMLIDTTVMSLINREILRSMESYALGVSNIPNQGLLLSVAA